MNSDDDLSGSVPAPRDAGYVRRVDGDDGAPRERPAGDVGGGVAGDGGPVEALRPVTARVRARLDELAAVPLDEQPAVFADMHAELTDALASAADN